MTIPPYNPPLNPFRSISTQMDAIGLVIIANLLALATLQGKQQLKRHPELLQCPTGILDLMPKLSITLFLITSVYFLYLALDDVKTKQTTNLYLVLLVNVLVTVATMIKTRVVFTAPPLSEATIAAIED